MRKIYPAPPDEKRVCEVCGESFTCGKREWAWKFRERPTCGRKCAGILRARKRTYLTEMPCTFCGNPFKPRNDDDKFCSRPCYWESKKRQPATYIPPRIQRVKVSCPPCHVTHWKRPKEVEQGSKFCSRLCYRMFHLKQGLGKRFPALGSNDFYLSVVWSRLKRMVKQRDAYTCQACKRVFSPKSPGMIVHHIRPRECFHTHGASLHPVADDPGNLMTLCRGCHQKTHAGHFPQFLDIAPHKALQLRLFT